MKNTSLCYIEKDSKYLMLHRTKKENDENKDKWLGIGGKFEPGESPEECAEREIAEETGLVPEKLLYRGIVTFVSDEFGTEYMHLFTCPAYSGQLSECSEGDLVFVDKNRIESLNIWEGDKIFFSLLKTDCPFFSLKLRYAGEKLTEAKLNGKEVVLPFKLKTVLE